MAVQTLLFSDLVADLSLAEFQFNAPYVMTADRSFTPVYTNDEYQAGDTISIRKQVRRKGGRGRVVVPTAIQETSTPLTIEPAYNDSFEFNSRELTLDVTKNAPKFQQRYVSPSVLDIASRIETSIAEAAVLQLNYVAGSPTALISDFAIVDSVNAGMIELGMPQSEKSMVLAARDASSLKAANQNAFNPVLNEDISFDSQLGRYSKFQMYETAANVIHQAGSGDGTPVVSIVPTSGDTTISISGLTPSALDVYRAGDTISFGVKGTAGAVESVHAVSYKKTGQLMTFTVQADVDADGTGNTVVSILPPIVSDITDTEQNVNQNIPLNAPVNLLGAGLEYRVNTAYTSRALSLVMPRLARVDSVKCGVAVDPETGMSLRIVMNYDILNDLNIARLDALAGFKWHQQYAFKVISAVS